MFKLLLELILKQFLLINLSIKPQVGTTMVACIYCIVSLFLPAPFSYVDPAPSLYQREIPAPTRQCRC